MGRVAFGAGLAAAVAVGYQSVAPRGQWYGRTFTGLKSGTRQLALTYDDGPNDPHTLRLLEVLARHEVKATFFLIGQYVTKRPDIVREVVKVRCGFCGNFMDAGDAICPFCGAPQG